MIHAPQSYPPTAPPRIALACSREGMGLTNDLTLLEEALQAVGLASQRVQWDDPAVPFEACSAVLLRHTWDYHLQPLLFTTWLGRLEAAGVPVFNPVQTVLANLHKGYLLQYQDDGVPIPASCLIQPGDSKPEDPLRLPAFFHEHSKVIVKPAISASSWRTALVATDDAAGFAAAVRTIHQDGDALVQAFVPEIHDGEWSLLYLGGAFSFAVH